MTKTGDIISFLSNGLFASVIRTGAAISDIISSSAANIIWAYLTSFDPSIVTDPEDDGLWPMFIGTLPEGETTSSACCISDIQGDLDGRHMNGSTVEHQKVQIKVRALDYDEAWLKMQVLCGLLEAVQNEEVSLDNTIFIIYSISMASSITRVDNTLSSFSSIRNENYVFSCSFTCTIRKLS